jgi:hypothetical protein
MTSTKQSGFGIVAIIVGILVLVGLGYVGYRAYTAQTNKPASTNNTTNNTPVDPNAGYIVIKEWGVRFTPVSGLSGVEYALTDGNTAQFTTSQLQALDPNCSAQKYPVLGGIVRSSDASVVSSKSLGKIGNYYYYYYTPQGVCSDQSSTRDVQTNSLAYLKDSLPSFEASQ